MLIFLGIALLIAAHQVGFSTFFDLYYASEWEMGQMLLLAGVASATWGLLKALERYFAIVFAVGMIGIAVAIPFVYFDVYSHAASLAIIVLTVRIILKDFVIKRK